MVTTSLQIDIHRPVADVFAFLMNPDNYLLWQAGLVEIKTTNGLSAGSTIAFTTIGMGRRFTLKAVVTHNDGHSTFSVISNRGSIRFESTYHLEEDDGGTQLQLMNEINTGTVFRMAEGVLQSISDARYEGDLQALKAILEGHS